jgi:hypothetical protein
MNGNKGVKPGNFENFLDMVLHSAGDKVVLSGFVCFGGIEDDTQSSAGDIVEIVEIK